MPFYSSIPIADEGMAFTITIERNEAEEQKLADEIAELRNSLQQNQ